MLSKQYTVEIQGHLDSEWSDLFHGMQVTYGGERVPTSILYGALDQAALLGVLARLHDRNVAILAVRCEPRAESG